MMMDWLAEQAAHNADGLALRFGSDRWRYADLDAAASKMCACLAAAGVLGGTHVGVLLPNCPDYLVLVHALLRVAAVLVPLNTRLTTTELRWQIEHADVALLICNADTAAIACALECPWLELPGTEASAPARQIETHSNAQFLVFTSGTSGRPKAVQLTRSNILAGAQASAARLGVQAHDCWLLCMPLYHVGGLAAALRSCIYGTAIDLQAGFDVNMVCSAIAAGHITIVSLVPTMLQRLLAAGAAPPPSLRCVLLGGAAAPPELVHRALALGWPIFPTYGLTETAAQAVTATPAEALAKPSSVGRSLDGIRVEVLGSGGQQLPGEVGEIAVAGPTVMQGYYKDVAASAAAMRDGKLLTGDLGYLDDAGDLFVVQRRSDLIVSGGENVYPAEVEAVLLGHPAVAECCVVGLPDAEWGQRVGAVVVANAGMELDVVELERACRAQLAGYKVPRTWQITGGLPRNSAGKVQREEVRGRFTVA